MAIDPNEEHLRVNGGRYGSSEICDLYVDFVRPGQGAFGEATRDGEAAAVLQFAR